MVESKSNYLGLVAQTPYWLCMLQHHLSIRNTKAVSTECPAVMLEGKATISPARFPKLPVYQQQYKATVYSEWCGLFRVIESLFCHPVLIHERTQWCDGFESSVMHGLRPC